MKVLFCANIPSPYRVAFFNELGKLCDLTVCYERKTAADRDAKWVGAQAQTYKEVYLDLTPLGTDKSWGNALRKFIASNTFDRLIMTNYVSPACMEAITYCKLKHIPYWVEYDGGFNKQDSLPKRLLKKYLVGGAVGHLTTCDEHIEYLKSLGIPTERIYKYPFTSLSESDLKLSLAIPPEEKSNAKAELGVSEEYMLLSVGRFSYEGGYGKGYDTLMEAAKSLPPSIGIYIVGDEPTQEFIEWKERESLSHVHFVGFKQKQDLALYYTAADAFILLSRGDIWGLVINEAMSFSLPVITTRQCLAGTELVQEGVNGYLIEAGDAENAVARINEIFACPEIPIRMGQESGRIIREYSIEKMAVTHSLHLRGERYKHKLNVHEKVMILSVGQMIHRKGFDVLLRAAKDFPPECGVYIVGGKPSPEMERLVREGNLQHVHFVDFMSKEALSEYYHAADLFVFPTREDIWGLVVNEAMAHGLPVITTTRSMAGMELVYEGENGFIIPSEDEAALAERVATFCQNEEYQAEMPPRCLETAMHFTIEKMAKHHMEILA